MEKDEEVYFTQEMFQKAQLVNGFGLKEIYYFSILFFPLTLIIWFFPIQIIFNPSFLDVYRVITIAIIGVFIFFLLQIRTLRGAKISSFEIMMELISFRKRKRKKQTIYKYIKKR